MAAVLRILPLLQCLHYPPFYVQLNLLLCVLYAGMCHCLRYCGIIKLPNASWAKNNHACFQKARLTLLHGSEKAEGIMYGIKTTFELDSALLGTRPLQQLVGSVLVCR